MMNLASGAQSFRSSNPTVVRVQSGKSGRPGMPGLTENPVYLDLQDAQRRWTIRKPDDFETDPQTRLHNSLNYEQGSSSPFKNILEQQKSRVPEAVGNRRLTGPIQFILGLLDCWKLEKEDAAYLLGFDETHSTYIAKALEGNQGLLGRDAKDRLLHLFAIRKSLHCFFRDLETENDWLREPQPWLEGQIPMTLLLEGSMEDILLVRAYIDSMVGR